jgi:flagellar basal body-associated protein FliL
MNKPYAFLADTREARLMQIKNDITNIIREYLVTQNIKEVLLDDYIIK